MSPSTAFIMSWELTGHEVVEDETSGKTTGPVSALPYQVGCGGCQCVWASFLLISLRLEISSKILEICLPSHGSPSSFWIKCNVLKCSLPCFKMSSYPHHQNTFVKLLSKDFMHFPSLRLGSCCFHPWPFHFLSQSDNQQSKAFSDPGNGHCHRSLP